MMNSHTTRVTKRRAEMLRRLAWASALVLSLAVADATQAAEPGVVRCPSVQQPTIRPAFSRVLQ